jgi:hypothetical protein
MSFTSINLPSTTSFVSIDTRTGPNKVIMLPAASTVTGRLFTIKDQYGSAALSTYTLSTIGMDKIDGRNWIYSFSNAFGAISFLSDGRVGWRVVGLYDGSSTAIPPVSDSGTFSPTSIATLVQWLDATDNTTVLTGVGGSQVANGGSAGYWGDKSGSANHVTTNAVAPVYSTSLISFKAGLNFQNSAGMISANFAKAASITLFLVGTVKSTIGSWGTFWGHFTSGRHDADIQLRNTAGQAVINWHTNNNNSTTQLPYTLDSPVLYSCTMSGGTVMFMQQTNTTGTTSLTVTEGTLTWAAGNAPVWIGRSDSSEVINSYISEIVYFQSVLSTLDRQKMEGYLAWKYGIHPYLPAGHPYLSAAPGATGRTYTFTGYTNSPGNPISYINSSSVTNGATTFSGSGGATETNVFYSYTNDIAAPVTKGVTKNASRDTINLPANTTGTQTTFLSYGPYNTSYTLAGSMPTGFSATAHTVIIIMYHLGTTAALGGSSGQGNNNSVASGGIMYQMGRSSVAGNFAINGQLVVGENGAWDYNGGYSMSINSTTVNIQSKVGWVMVAFVWRAGNTCAYYYNGSTAMSSGGGNGTSQVAGTIYIGVDQRATYYNGVPGSCLNAEIAFYGLWNSALTATQIGAFYTQHAAQFSGGFV